jgi:tRNA/rRNA methyltransferase
VKARPAKVTPAKAGETEQVTGLLMQALRDSGYVNPLTAASSEEKIRRMVRRFRITAHDAPVLMGMLRQILWKLDNAPSGRGSE